MAAPAKRGNNGRARERTTLGGVYQQEIIVRWMLPIDHTQPLRFLPPAFHSLFDDLPRRDGEGSPKGARQASPGQRPGLDRQKYPKP